MVPNSCVAYVSYKYLYDSNYVLIYWFYLFIYFYFYFFQAVLEKQSYMLIGRHDIEKLMRRDPASSCLPNPFGQPNMERNASDVDVEVEMELCNLLLSLRPIKQVSCLDDIILFCFANYVHSIRMINLYVFLFFSLFF